MIKILFVCHGNICRSPMAEYVMKYLVSQKGLEEKFYIDSAATSTEEIGNGVHYGTRNKLQSVNIPVGNHKARQITKNDIEEFDYLIGMDSANIRNMKRFYGFDGFSFGSYQTKSNSATNKNLENKMPVDMVEIDITNAWNLLGEITGETYKDELMNTLFSNFCLGK